MLIFLDKSLQSVVHNFEYKIISKKKMAELVNIKSTYTLDCIKQGKTYKDYALSYSKLNIEQKNKLASLLSN